MSGVSRTTNGTSAFVPVTAVDAVPVTSTAHEGARRREIIAAARELYEHKGIDHTSVKDITEKVGVTRSLFYHYFENKEAVTDAILDDYVGNFVQLVHFWNESRERGNVRKSLDDCVAMLRRGLFDNDSFRQDLLKEQNASLYLRFMQRTSATLARYLTDTTAVEYARYHTIEVEYLYETFYLLVIGLIGFMRRNPDTPDEVVAALIAQTLHLDLGDGSTSNSASNDGPNVDAPHEGEATGR